MRRRLKRSYAKEAMEFLNHVMKDKPLLPFLIPLGLFAWAVERWLVPFSNWVPLAAAVWATIQVILSCCLVSFWSRKFGSWTILWGNCGSSLLNSAAVVGLF